MNDLVVIIGASGHGKVIADIIRKSGDIVAGFLDDNKNISALFMGFPILGAVEDYSNYLSCKFVIGIGDAYIRERISKKLDGVSWYTAVHPTAVLSTLDIMIDQGTVIMANAVINSGAHIGKHCIINTGAIVEHDNQIADYVHISVGAKLAGNVAIGERTWVGIGASISNNVTIDKDCTIGAGAVVAFHCYLFQTFVSFYSKLSWRIFR